MQGVKPKFGHRYWPEAGPLTWLYLTYFFWLFIGLSAGMLFVRGWREHLGEPCDRKKSFHTIYLPGLQRCIGGATNFPLWFNIPVQPYGNVLCAVCLFLSTSNPRTILRFFYCAQSNYIHSIKRLRV